MENDDDEVIVVSPDADDFGAGVEETSPAPVATAAPVVASASGEQEHRPSAPPAGFDKETHDRYEKIKRGDLHITDLQRMGIPELHEVAKEEGVVDYAALKKQELIFKILKERINKNGLMYGEGVLEILPDGFGFLRSPEYNYIPCPDDIYISPSQIRRFGLRSGHITPGRFVRPRSRKSISPSFALRRSASRSPTK